MRRHRWLTVPIALAAGVILTIPALGTNADEAHGSFRQTNLISDGFVPAQFVDPSLKNPWGISSSRTSPMWVSDNNAGVTTLYRGDGSKVPLTVTIPPATPSPAGTMGSPTGTVFNGNSTEFRGDLFLFATEDGTLAGWKPSDGLLATTEVNNPHGDTGPVYKGLAIGFDGLADHLYAANFRFGIVDVFNSDFSTAGSFTDPKLPAGYAPFNVQNLGGVLYVTFAKQNAQKHDDVAGAGHGFVDAFDLSGHLLDRLVSRGRLNSPWGLAIAPASFGPLAGDLLVGNFGDGRIDAYTLDEGNFRGTLRATNGDPIAIDGLWALRVGNGGGGANGGDPNAVYFTAGINHEMDGLFGTIERN
jgi:uncharacterized protein (TIGR03118 family)